MDLQNKKIAILGFGVEGESVVRFLKTQHVSEIAIFSEKEISEENRTVAEKLKEEGIRVSIGPFPELSHYDVIVRSPSIRPDIPCISQARQKGSVITSSTKLFFTLCPCPIIGVTGTKGKGTTASLIYEMLKKSGRDSYLGGNIGVSPLDFLDRLTPQSIVVLELSSFQLWDVEQSPHIGVLVMTTSEHLDVHESEEEYLEAKSHLFLYQKEGDFAVINSDFPNSQKVVTAVHVPTYKTSIKQACRPGCYVNGDVIVYDDGKKAEDVVLVSHIFIPGKHNWQNVCSAICAVKILGVSTHVIRDVVMTFTGLVHRLEYVREVLGVRYFDDSFSTTPETAIAAIEAFTEPKILILGGSSKKSDFTELGKIISESNSIRGIIGIGDEWQRIKAVIKNPSYPVIENCNSMQEVVKKAAEMAKDGDVVLLSPACASFGMFKNYKDRGDQFKAEVKKL